MRRIIFCAVPLLISLASSVRSEAFEVDQYTAIHVGKLIVGNGEELDDVTVLLLEGKIEAVGKNIDLPHPCREIDARHLVAMPGLIHPSTRRGLMSMSRSGVAANRTIGEEFLPEDDAYDGALEAGFTTLVLAPPGTSGFPGRAMFIRTKDLGEGLILQPEAWVGMNLPRPGRDKTTLRKGFVDAKKEIEKLAKARKDFDEKQKKAAEEAAKKKAAEEAAKKKKDAGKDPEKKQGMARDEDKGDSKKKEEAPKKPEFKAPPMNPALVPLVDMIEKKPGVFGLIVMGGASTYLHIRDALRDFDVPYVLMQGGGGGRGRFGGGSADLFFVAEQMGEREETILLAPRITDYPSSRNKMNIPQRLMDAGCKVGFLPSGDSDSALEAFRFQTAELLKAGTSREDAIQAMTLHVAEAMGLGERMGSVEKGKDANLVLLSADVFDVQARVEMVVLEAQVVYERDDEED